MKIEKPRKLNWINAEGICRKCGTKIQLDENDSPEFINRSSVGHNDFVDGVSTKFYRIFQWRILCPRCNETIELSNYIYYTDITGKEQL